jgi:hypothetical protein
MTFDITVNTYIHMCGIIVPEHTCDEYSILLEKSGMTQTPSKEEGEGRY